MAFNGLIQHSFALRLADAHRPFSGRDIGARIQERFALPATGGAAFEVRPVCESAVPGGRAGERRGARVAEHSPLVQAGRTSVRPLPLSFSGADGSRSDPGLPPAFAWAGEGGGALDPRQDGPTFVFAAAGAGTGQLECNDYLVERSGCEPEAGSISSSLLEILAHKRSRLLGLALSSRIVSVMLPHAVLTQVQGEARSQGDRSWFVQPLVSLIRDGRVRTEFRASYSLTLLLVPVTANGFRQRQVTAKEIDRTVNAGWSLAAGPTPEKLPRFQARGPLLEYLPRLAAPCDPAALLRPPGSGAENGACPESLTLRQGTEVLAFGLGLRLAQGAAGRATERTIRGIGDDVVTALGSARVSSVLVVDDFSRADVRGEEEAPLRRHRDLMARISRETRPPLRSSQWRKYRLDRAFVDDDTYVVGVVPARRCLVVSCAAEAQHGWHQSGLMQAGSVTHLAVGAATAIGTLRAIDRDLEGLEDASPKEIAAIDGEIATDLRELYDLDITSEEYRSLYRLLRRRLGITRDYEALQDKMKTLYRSTSTRHEARAQWLLAAMTAAIVVLSLMLVAIEVAH